MLFRNLLELDFNKNTGVIDRDQISKILHKTPPDVLEMYCFHGRKDEFQEQYSDINIGNLNWRISSCYAYDILKCSLYSEFVEWVNSVSERLNNFDTIGWSCIHHDSDIVNNWKTHKTWISPPIFLDGGIISNSCNFHLMEGHSRFGILKGLINNQIIKSNSKHFIWKGKFNNILKKSHLT